jgi:cell division septal protein FtsQ
MGKFRLKKKDNFEIGRRSNYANPQSKFQTNIIKISRTLSSPQIDRLLSQNDMESIRVKTQKLTNHRRKIGLIFSVSAIIVFLLISLIIQLTGSVMVSYSSAKVNKNVNIEQYKSAMEKYLNDNPLSRFRSALNSSDLDKYMLINYPEVLSVKDNGKNNIYETNYYFTFRQPVAGWQIDDNKYYVDDKGVSFRLNYFTEPTLQVVDNSGIKLDKGAAIASNSFLAFVGTVVSETRKIGYVLTEASIPLDSTRELDIKLKGRETYVKLAVDRVVDAQVEDMNHAFVYLDSKNIRPSYIDVRVSGKAYYK